MIRLGVSQQYLKLESSNPWLHWNEPEVHGALSSCLFLNLFSVVIGICWGSIWFTWKPEFVGLELLHHRVAFFICWHWTKSTELGNLHQVNMGGVLVVAHNSHPCASSGPNALFRTMKPNFEPKSNNAFIKEMAPWDGNFTTKNTNLGLEVQRGADKDKILSPISLKLWTCQTNYTKHSWDHLQGTPNE